MATLSFLIFTLLVALLVLGVWQLLSFKKHSKTSFSNTQLNDQKYYELKYQMQFVTSVVPIIFSVFLYAGYTQLDALPKKIEEDIHKVLDPQIEDLKKSNKNLLKEQENLIEKYKYLDVFYQNLKGKGTDIDQSLGSSKFTLNLLEKRLNSLQTQTNTISNKDIVSQPIYVVSNLKFRMDKQDPQYYKFADYKTISGNRLPEFTKPPLIIAFSNFGAQIIICGVTNKQFNASHGMSSDGLFCKSVINNQVEFGLIIFEEK